VQGTPLHFASRSAKPSKRLAGRTPVQATPLHVRSMGPGLDTDTRSWLQARTTRQLAKFAGHIERVSLRFEDVNGPRGGRDTVCRAKVVLSQLPSVVVEERAKNARFAFDRAIPSAARAVSRAIGRAAPSLPGRSARGLRAETTRRAGPAKRAAAGSVAARAQRATRNPEGALIGRRVGQGRKNLLSAAARPEKLRRDTPVDTARRGVSASDRRVGAAATATRNTKLNRRGMVSALEDSATGKPSRKSTRRSQNRGKPDAKLGRRTKRRLNAPQAKARRSAARSS
jgi:hypothetical protein